MQTMIKSVTYQYLKLQIQRSNYRIIEPYPVPIREPHQIGTDQDYYFSDNDDEDAQKRIGGRHQSIDLI